MFSDHSGIVLEINNYKQLEIPPDIWKLTNSFLINRETKKNFQDKAKNILNLMKM